MARRSEQGNVLGFVLVGALLVATLLGGIFVVRRIASTQTGSGNEVSVTAPVGSDSSTDKTSDTSTTTTDEATTQSEKEKEDKAALENALNSQNSSSQSTTSTAQTTTESTAQSSSTTGASTTGSTGSLPKTGPEDTALTIAGATLLSAVAISYVRSRHLI